MSTEINSLTDKQATHAVKLFLELSSPELWTEGRKPSPERVQQIGDAVVSSAPADVQAVVTGLAQDTAESAGQARGEVARLILTKLSETEEFHATVQQAVASACQPHKAIDYATGAFIVAFLLATTRIEPTPNGRKISFGAGMPDILRELPAVIKSLPEGVWSFFKGGKPGG